LQDIAAGTETDNTLTIMGNDGHVELIDEICQIGIAVVKLVIAGHKGIEFQCIHNGSIRVASE